MDISQARTKRLSRFDKLRQQLGQSQTHHEQSFESDNIEDEDQIHCDMDAGAKGPIKYKTQGNGLRMGMVGQQGEGVWKRIQCSMQCSNTFSLSLKFPLLLISVIMIGFFVEIYLSLASMHMHMHVGSGNAVTRVDTNETDLFSPAKLMRPTSEASRTASAEQDQQEQEQPTKAKAMSSDKERIPWILQPERYRETIPRPNVTTEFKSLSHPVTEPQQLPPSLATINSTITGVLPKADIKESLFVVTTAQDNITVPAATDSTNKSTNASKPFKLKYRNSYSTNLLGGNDLGLKVNRLVAQMGTKPVAIAKKSPVDEASKNELPEGDLDNIDPQEGLSFDQLRTEAEKDLLTADALETQGNGIGPVSPEDSTPIPTPVNQRSEIRSFSRDMHQHAEFWGAVSPNTIKWSPMIVVVQSTFEYRALVVNWIAWFMSSARIERYLILTHDRKLRDFLSQREIPVFLFHEKHPVLCFPVHDVEAYYVSKANANLRKLRLLDNLLRIGRTVIFSAPDAIWINNPLADLNNVTKNVFASFSGSDGLSPPYLPISPGIEIFSRQRRISSNLVNELETKFSFHVYTRCGTGKQVDDEQFWWVKAMNTSSTAQIKKKKDDFHYIDSIYKSELMTSAGSFPFEWQILSENMVLNTCTNFEERVESAKIVYLKKGCAPHCQGELLQVFNESVLATPEADANSIEQRLRCLGLWKLPDDWESIPPQSFKRRVFHYVPLA